MNPGDGPVPLILLVCVSLTIFAASVRLEHRAERRRPRAPEPSDWD